jgi:hypothetical protein
MLTKTSEDDADMLSVLSVTPAGHLEVILEGETEEQLVLSIFLKKVLLALGRLKGILVYLNSPNGVSSGCIGI